VMAIRIGRLAACTAAGRFWAHNHNVKQEQDQDQNKQPIGHRLAVSLNELRHDVHLLPSIGYTIRCACPDVATIVKGACVVIWLQSQRSSLLGKLSPYFLMGD